MATPEAAAFNVRFNEAIANLRGKVPTVTEHWYDLAGPAHAQIFTVAGAPTVDLVGDIHDAINNAIANGTTLGQFRKDWDKIIAQHGWSYKGSRGWRTQVIYRANMSSASAAGHWQKLWDNREREPYLQYDAILDNRTRPQHRAWSGIVLPITHPFWKTHYPPNGWLCRCGVIGCNDHDLRRNGWELSDPPEIDYRDVVTRDGEIVDRVPVGIDPGWDHNVGISWLQPELALGEKLATLPPQLAATAVDRTMTPAYLDAVTQRWQSWRQEVSRDAAQADTQIAGFLGSRVLGAMQAQSKPLTSVSVIAHHEALPQAVSGSANPAPDAWPQPWVDALPTLMGNYQAAMLDTETGMIVLIPSGQPRGGRLRIVSIKRDGVYGNQRAAAVQSLGSAAPRELQAPRYVLLDGSLQAQ